jgi:hypothetical protein
VRVTGAGEIRQRRAGPQMAANTATCLPFPKQRKDRQVSFPAAPAIKKGRLATRVRTSATVTATGPRQGVGFPRPRIGVRVSRGLQSLMPLSTTHELIPAEAPTLADRWMYAQKGQLANSALSQTRGVLLGVLHERKRQLQGMAPSPP